MGKLLHVAHMGIQQTAISMKTKKVNIPYYTVSVAYKVRTKEQANELVRALNKTYNDKVDKWCNDPLELKKSLKFIDTLAKKA